MKSTGALWSLYTRSIIYKLLAVLAVLAAADGAAFCLRAADAEYLAQAVPERFWQVGFVLAVLVLTTLLVMPGWKGGRSDYTLQRTGVSEQKQYALRAAFHSLCLFMLIAAQALVLVLLCVVFEKSHVNAFTGPQNIPLLFYRSSFLHALLPLADVSRLVRNAVMIAAYGVVTAAPETANLRGKDRVKKEGFIIAYAVFFASCFGAVPMMNLPFDLFFAGLSLAAALIQAALVRKGRGKADECEA